MKGYSSDVKTSVWSIWFHTCIYKYVNKFLFIDKQDIFILNSKNITLQRINFWNQKQHVLPILDIPKR